MRRKDREVTDAAKIKEIIADCYCCRLGLNDNGKVYIVPLSFGYTETDGAYVFYFHGAKEGRKLDIIKNNNYAGFELDTDYKLHEADQACSYSCRFKSIIGTGRVSIIEDIQEKKHALRLIMQHNSGKYDWDFPDNMLNAVCTFKLSVDELACKEHL